MSLTGAGSRHTLLCYLTPPVGHCTTRPKPALRDIFEVGSLRIFWRAHRAKVRYDAELNWRILEQ